MTTVRELSAGMTFRGEVVHACWSEPFRGGITLSPLCGRRVLITSPRPKAEPTCVGCLRELRAADRAATAVMESVLHEQHGICERCGCERWTLQPTGFGRWPWLTCLICREVEGVA